MHGCCKLFCPFIVPPTGQLPCGILKSLEKLLRYLAECFQFELELFCECMLVPQVLHQGFEVSGLLLYFFSELSSFHGFSS